MHSTSGACTAGGVLGSILIGCFSDPKISGSLVERRALGKQIVATLIAAVYSYVVTVVILKLIGLVMRLKPTKEEMADIDGPSMESSPTLPPLATRSTPPATSGRRRDGSGCGAGQEPARDQDEKQTRHRGGRRSGVGELSPCLAHTSQGCDRKVRHPARSCQATVRLGTPLP